MVKEITENQQIVDFFLETTIPTDKYFARYYPHGERDPDPLRNTKANRKQIMQEIDPLIDPIIAEKCKTDKKFCKKISPNMREEIKQAFFDNLETLASEPSESELHRMWKP